MPDVFTKAKRSEVMAKIRSRGNQATELALVKLFRAHHIIGWRRHVEIKNGKAAGKRKSARASLLRPFRVRPDFVFRQSRLAVFVDGCFWHGCPRHKTQPKNNRAFWKNKFAYNQARDRRVNQALRRLGWRVIRLWECALKKAPLSSLRRIQRALPSSKR